MESIIKDWFSEKQKAHAGILRDLLIEIFKRNPKDLTFKGGTAISFFYGSDRFSGDIDLSSSDIGDYSVIDDALETLEKTYNYTITNNWEDEIYQKSRFRRYFLTFKYGSFDSISATIDYSVGSCMLGVEKIDLSNGYFAAKVGVMKPEELLAEKVRTIYARHKGRDLYDLYYLCVVMKTMIGRSIIASKMSEDPSLKAKKYSFASFRKRILELKPYWSDLDGLVNNFNSLEFDRFSNAVIEAFRNI
ncbi:MAG: nucleotidyl transferase AbiEii/AbiGii toxin family protein [Candidatus Micrarchaeaceae archaeon]